jgi:hypothetical protein
LKAQAEAGRLSIPERVFEDITNLDGALASWIRKCNSSKLVSDAPSKVQFLSGYITKHVMERYEHQYANRFVNCGDLWIVAHAKELGGAVVTREILPDVIRREAKVVDVCNQFGVPVKDIWTMLKELNASFG